MTIKAIKEFPGITLAGIINLCLMLTLAVQRHRVQEPILNKLTENTCCQRGDTLTIIYAPSCQNQTSKGIRLDAQI